MRDNRSVPSHEHKSFDIQPLDICRACDDFHERSGLTIEKIEEAYLTAPTLGALRLLRMLKEIDPERHAKYIEWIKQGVLLADAVDEAMGEWPKEFHESE